MFTVSLSQSRDAIVVSISGAIDVANIDAVKAALAEALLRGPRAIVVSLENVKYFDGSLMNALLRWSARAREQGTWVFLARPSSLTGRRICDLIGLSRSIMTFDTVAQAIESAEELISAADDLKSAPPLTLVLSHSKRR